MNSTVLDKLLATNLSAHQRQSLHGGTDSEPFCSYRCRLNVYETIIIVWAVALVTNLIILLSCLWLRKKPSINLMLCISLVGADTWSSFVNIQMIIFAYYFSVTQQNPAPNLICLLLVMSSVLWASSITCILHLLMIAINHFLGTVWPLQHKLWFTNRLGKICIIIMWLTPAVAYLLVISVQPGKGLWLKITQPDGLCEFNDHMYAKFRLGQTIPILTSFVLTVMAYCYILHVIRSRTVDGRNISMGISMSVPLPGAPDHRRKSSYSVVRDNSGVSSGSFRRGIDEVDLDDSTTRRKSSFALEIANVGSNLFSSAAATFHNTILTPNIALRNIVNRRRLSCHPQHLIGTHQQSSSGSTNTGKSRKQGILTTLLITGSFGLGWLPITLLNQLVCKTNCMIKINENPDLAFVLTTSGYSLIIVKHMCNALIYALRIAEIRQAIFRMCKRCCCRCCLSRVQRFDTTWGGENSMISSMISAAPSGKWANKHNCDSGSAVRHKQVLVASNSENNPTSSGNAEPRVRNATFGETSVKKRKQETDSASRRRCCSMSGSGLASTEINLTIATSAPSEMLNQSKQPSSGKHNQSTTSSSIITLPNQLRVTSNGKSNQSGYNFSPSVHHRLVLRSIKKWKSSCKEQTSISFDKAKNLNKAISKKTSSRDKTPVKLEGNSREIETSIPPKIGKSRLQTLDSKNGSIASINSAGGSSSGKNSDLRKGMSQFQKPAVENCEKSSCASELTISDKFVGMQPKYNPYPVHNSNKLLTYGTSKENNKQCNYRGNYISIDRTNASNNNTTSVNNNNNNNNNSSNTYFSNSPDSNMNNNYWPERLHCSRASSSIINTEPDNSTNFEVAIDSKINSKSFCSATISAIPSSPNISTNVPHVGATVLVRCTNSDSYAPKTTTKLIINTGDQTDPNCLETDHDSIGNEENTKLLLRTAEEKDLKHDSPYISVHHSLI